MRHRYLYLDPELIKSLLAGLDLLRLFNQLLLAAGGEVETAKEWMRDLQQRGYIDEGVDLEAFFAKLEEEGMLARDGEGALQLTASGQRRMRRDAFEEVFSSLKKAGPGYHPISASGEGVERQPETRPYSFGDELHSIDAIRSTQNALRRTVGDLDLAEEDLEVAETEHLTSCATIVAIDISHSMVLYGEDRITPAKTVALALTELITSKYPKDYVGVIVFGDRAQRIELAGIPAIQAGPFHTNTCEALQVARSLLAQRKHPNKQIFLVTDGKPSAITEGHRLYKNPFGLDLKIVNRTLEEADQCRRQKVVITTFMIATDPLLQDFVEKLTRINRGRAYFANPYNLGEFILADYMANRRKRVH
ncbi:MAG TPA: VWA domain-containing protein [Thermoanaerobaculaceae bacterium]|nr:VWA domain-containing protein [Thermoanaerobaculaceae bacterium]